MISTCVAKTKAEAPRRRGKPILPTLAGCATALLLWAVAGLFLYVVPATDAPGHADVLFVLGPPDDRLGYAEQLMEQGHADTLVVAVQQDSDSDPDLALCRERRAYRVVCFLPEPFTTQGEALTLQRLTTEYGWKSADVLTAQYHVTRARVILQRCFKGDLGLIAYQQDLPVLSFTNPRGSWAYIFAYQTAAFIKVALNQEC
jgi:hypothetical protein